MDRPIGGNTRTPVEMGVTEGCTSFRKGDLLRLLGFGTGGMTSVD